MSAKYVQIYNEIYDLGLGKADFYHFLKLCQKELKFENCQIAYRTDKELAEKHNWNDKEFSKFIKRLIEKGLARRSTFETFEIVNKESKNITMKALLINPEYVFFGGLDSRKNEIEIFYKYNQKGV